MSNQPTNRQLKAANWYVKHDIPVFPLPAGSKKPFPGSHGFKDHSKNRHKIESWFDNELEYNIGIPTGRVSGFFVIDLDVYKDGVQDSVDVLENKHGVFPETLEVGSPRGGRHLFYRYPDDMVIDCRNTFPVGIDVRGDKGYILAPPSTFEGKKYRWVNKPDFNRIAEAPDWFSEYLGPKRDASGHYVAKSSTEWGAVAQPVSEGGRHERVLSIAGLLLHKMQPQAELAESLIHAWNETNCKPPLSDYEVGEIIDYIANKERQEIEELLGGGS